MVSQLRRRIGVLAALTVLALSLLAASGGTAQAATSVNLFEAAGPPTVNCPIIAYASATPFFNGTSSFGRMHTTINIGPNQMWFSGCRVNVRIDLYVHFPGLPGEVIAQTFQHQVVA